MAARKGVGRIYGVLLRVFPRAFRARFGAQMTADFEARHADAAHRGWAARGWFWARTCGDIVVHARAVKRGISTRRGGSMFHEFLYDCRMSARYFLARRGVTATAVVTLAVGIGVNTAVFSVLHGVLVSPLPFAHEERMVALAEYFSKTGEPPVADAFEPLNGSNFLDIQRATGSVFDALAAYRSLPALTLSGSGDAVKVSGLEVRPEYFALLAPPLLGRPLTSADLAEAASAVVVSHEFWRRQLGADPAIVGRSITLDGRSTQVVGVMPAGTAYPADIDVFRPLVLKDEPVVARTTWQYAAIGRLKQGVSVETASAAVREAMARGRAPGADGRTNLAAAIALRDFDTRNVRQLLWFVQSIGLVILLIVCANLANLLLTSLTARQQELAIREAIGADRWRLARQVLAEQLLLGIVGALSGAAVAYLATPVLVAHYTGALPGRERIVVSGDELAFSIGAAVLTTFAFALIPAWLSTGPQVRGGLRAGARVGSPRIVSLLRQGLIVSEVVLTLTLVAGGAVLIKSYLHLTSQPTGLDSRNVTTAYFQVPASLFPQPEQRRHVFDVLLDRVSHEPTVEAAATTLPLPFDLSGNGRMWTWAAGQPVSGRVVTSSRWVSPNYARVLQIPLIRGRFFLSTDDERAPNVVVVNEAFVKKFVKGVDPIGLQLDSPRATIVGVIADARSIFHEQAGAEVLRPFAQDPRTVSTLILKTRGRDPGLANRVREIAHEAFPTLPVGRIDTLQSIIGDSVSEQRFNMLLLATLAAVAVGLAVVGIYGVVSVAVNQRRREMGIRAALGAAPRSLRRLVVTQGTVPIAIGIAGGLAGAWVLTTLLKKELFEVEPHDPSMLLASSTLFLAVGLIACWVPARRAGRVNPVDALKAE